MLENKHPYGNMAVLVNARQPGQGRREGTRGAVLLAVSGSGRRAPRLEQLRLDEGADTHRHHQGIGIRASPRTRPPRGTRQSLARRAGAAVANDEPRRMLLPVRYLVSFRLSYRI